MMSRHGPPRGTANRSKPPPILLNVETLMGTAFEIKVSPNDTILTVKNKIQTSEGIPGSQQHLLYNMDELKDTSLIRDYSIPNGATIKLIVSMRVGPISTKRAPEVDELAWRELQELISDTPKDDLLDRLPPGTKLTVLIFQDVDQVGFLKVLENEDGTFSPLSDAWNGSSIRTLFSKANALDPDERFEEDSVPTGKVEELKERLEALTIHKKEDYPPDGILKAPVVGSRLFGGKKDNKRSVKVVSYLSTNLSCITGSSRAYRRSQREGEDSDSFRSRTLFPSLFSHPRAPLISRSRLRKEVDKLSQMYKTRRVVAVNSESSHGSRRPPLPEIRRCPSSDREKVVSEDEKVDDNSREKTATSFATVEEENAVSPSPICSSQSSAVALPASEEVAAAAALAPIAKDRVSPTVSRSMYKVSSYMAEKDGASKKTPGKSDERKGAKTEAPKGAARVHKCATCSNVKAINYARLLRRFSRMAPADNAKEKETISVEEIPARIRNGTVMKIISIENGRVKEYKTSDDGPSIVINHPPIHEEPYRHTKTKKRLRCTQCNKKLNITNTYDCRCGGGPFCSVHRYSEVHDCPIDYRGQGRRIISETNPVIAPSKLPKI